MAVKAMLIMMTITEGMAMRMMTAECKRWNLEIICNGIIQYQHHGDDGNDDDDDNDDENLR